MKFGTLYPTEKELGQTDMRSSSYERFIVFFYGEHVGFGFTKSSGLGVHKEVWAWGSERGLGLGCRKRSGFGTRKRTMGMEDGVD